MLVPCLLDAYHITKMQLQIRDFQDGESESEQLRFTVLSFVLFVTVNVSCIVFAGLMDKKEVYMAHKNGELQVEAGPPKQTIPIT